MKKNQTATGTNSDIQSIKRGFAIGDRTTDDFNIDKGIYANEYFDALYERLEQELSRQTQIDEPEIIYADRQSIAHDLHEKSEKLKNLATRFQKKANEQTTLKKGLKTQLHSYALEENKERNK